MWLVNTHKCVLICPMLRGVQGLGAARGSMLRGAGRTCAVPSGSSTVLARRRDLVSRLSCTLSCSIARSIIGSRSAGRGCARWPSVGCLYPWPVPEGPGPWASVDSGRMFPLGAALLGPDASCCGAALHCGGCSHDAPSRRKHTMCWDHCFTHLSTLNTYFTFSA